MAEPSFPDIQVTGPVHNYVRAMFADENDTTGIDSRIFYLGTCEVTPQMQRRKFKSPVKNEIAGPTLDFQRTYDGEAARVTLMLTRFSNLAWGSILLAGRARGLLGPSGSAQAGREGRWSRGAPVFGQMTFELWQVYENSPFLNPLTRFPTLEIGWYWPQVEIESHDTVKAGPQGQALLLTLDCQPWWIPQASSSTVNNAANERGWILYTNDPDDFPQDVLVPQ